MKKSLKELSDLVGGEISGENVFIKGIAKVEEAKEGEITFAVSGRFLKKAEQSKASAVIVPLEVKEFNKPIIRVKNPRLAFAQLLEFFTPQRFRFLGVHTTAIIGKNVKIGQRVTIGSYSVVEDGVILGDDVYLSSFTYLGRGVSVGKGSFLHPRVTVLDGTSIGERVIIHSGAVIGSDGFGFVKKEDGSYYKIPQVGRVIVEDEVEIGANVSIDRATIGETRIGKGTKIDNLVHIAHNVKVGENVVMVALVGISGSSSIGDGVILAGQAGVTEHVNIGSGAVVAAKAGVTKDIPPNLFVSGFPARNHAKQKRIKAVTYRLPEILKRIERLEKSIKDTTI